VRPPRHDSEQETICRDLESEESGYFAARVLEATVGTLYRFRLDGDPQAYPDPASRFQPQGPHGPSAVIDPTSFEWPDSGWKAIGVKGQVLYEMHIGTFTQEGTWEAASRELAELADTGITVLEIMPVADFPGRFGWGYDGVDLFAPTRLYGPPESFRRFVKRAHEVDLGVILDVVYNHLGPDAGTTY
jgi:maltooligosyltrehalose trehalohydrolase